MSAGSILNSGHWLEDTSAPKPPNMRPAREESQTNSEMPSSAPGTPNSLGSAQMDESDDEDSAPAPKPSAANDFASKYPVDGKYVSIAEKMEMAKMTEFAREQILAEREEEKSRAQTNSILQRLMTLDSDKKLKRSASDADLEPTDRNQSRARKGEPTSGIDTLRNRRAEKSERNRRREEEKEYRRSRSPGRHYDDDFGDDRDSGSDVEWADNKKKDKFEEVKEQPPAELADVERVRLSRSRFGQVCYYPGMKEAVKDTFVRIAVGPDPESGQNIYRMAVIKGERAMSTDGTLDHG